MSATKSAEGCADGAADTELFDYPLDLSLSYVVRIAHRLLVRDLDKALSSVGVSRGQWYFLNALWQEDGLTQRELSDRVGMKEPTTALALNGMEKSHLVYRVRDKGDLRKVRVYLTEAGHGMRNVLLPMIKTINDRATTDISPQDLATFHLVAKEITRKLCTTEELDPLAFGCPSLQPAPCWRTASSDGSTVSDPNNAPSIAVGDPASSPREQELRNQQACADCFAISRGNPDCPPRAA